jgi:hypothetical protein
MKNNNEKLFDFSKYGFRLMHTYHPWEAVWYRTGYVLYEVRNPKDGVIQTSYANIWVVDVEHMLEHMGETLSVYRFNNYHAKHEDSMELIHTGCKTDWKELKSLFREEKIDGILKEKESD